MESANAVMIDQDLINSFWLVVGYIVISNVGMIIEFCWDRYKRSKKMRADIDQAHKQIRILREEIRKLKGEEP